MTTTERNQLVEQNLGLVNQLVNKWADRIPASMKEDAEQVGYLAMVKAADKFDPTVNHNFGTYAMVAVRRAIVRYVESNRNVVSLSWRAQAKGVKLQTIFSSGA